MSRCGARGVTVDPWTWRPWHPTEVAHALRVRRAGCRRVNPLDSKAFEESHQTWARERATGVYRLDVFREPRDGDVWICRRDETIRAPIAQIVRHIADGIPHLTPEVVLLFKAKATRDKDEADFTTALPQLSAAQREWPRDALTRIHPRHEWIQRI